MSKGCLIRPSCCCHSWMCHFSFIELVFSAFGIKYCFTAQLCALVIFQLFPMYLWDRLSDVELQSKNINVCYLARCSSLGIVPFCIPISK